MDNPNKEKYTRMAFYVLFIILSFITGIVFGPNIMKRFKIPDIEVGVISVLQMVILLILGFFIGFIINDFLKHIKEENFKKIEKYYKNSPIEFTILIFSIIVVTIITIFGFFETVIPVKLVSPLMQVIFSSIATWIVTRYANKETFDKEQKQTAVRSYRHSLSTKSKIDYGLHTIDLINEDIVKCNFDHKIAECTLSHNLYRIRDSLIVAKMDSSRNIDDWSDILADELNIVKNYKRKESEIHSLELEIQYLDKEDEEENLLLANKKKGIEKLKKEMKEMKESLDLKIMYSLNAEEKFEDEYMVHLDYEIKCKKANRKKEELKIDKIPKKEEKGSA